MNKIISSQKHLFAAAVLITCLLVLSASCASGVSREDYDQVESDLARVTAELDQIREEIEATREETATAREALSSAQVSWQTLEPLMEIQPILVQNSKDYHQLQLGEITQEEYNARVKALWAKAELCLIKIGDEELTDSLIRMWFEPIGSNKKRVFVAEFCDQHYRLTKKDMEDLSHKLGE